MVRCPVCSEELVVEDCYDTEFDGTEVVTTWEGYCEKCGRVFQWQEVYEFRHYMNLKETGRVKENNSMRLY